MFSKLPTDIIKYKILQFIEIMIIDKFSKFEHLKKILIKLHDKKFYIYPNIKVKFGNYITFDNYKNFISTINIYGGCNYLKFTKFPFNQLLNFNENKCKNLIVDLNKSNRFDYVPKNLNVYLLSIDYSYKRRRSISLPSHINYKKLYIKRCIINDMPKTFQCEKLKLRYIKNFNKKILNGNNLINNLSFHNCVNIIKIPENFKCDKWKIMNYNTISKIPPYFKCNKLVIGGKNTISEIPPCLKCNKLKIWGNNTIKKIPPNLKCDILEIGGENTISEIPENFKCDKLWIGGINTISKIPPCLKCKKLNIGGRNTISEISPHFKCNKLKIYGNNAISEIPPYFKCYNLYINGKYTNFNSIPINNKCENLCIRSLTLINKYPENIKVKLNSDSCIALKGFYIDKILFNK
jgi:hypothetical protein